ncbi:MAG: NAD-dependent epimerase/dehydratase family protein [Gammaproteobacteria bacterium]|nr:NAD-dependent epimerase/dehydratase family protein [Gammaproteobacteria bacterium]
MSPSTSRPASDAGRHTSRPAFVEMDIRDPELSMLCHGVDSIVHCAALVDGRSSEDVWSVNRDGTLNVLDAVGHAGVKRLVHISTASVVFDGRNIEDGDESLPYARALTNTYIKSKIAAERLVLAHDGGASVCALRPHTVFGPGDRRVSLQAVGQKWEIGNRDKRTDLTYVTNLADAVLQAESRLGPGSKLHGQAYFTTNGEPIPFFEFVERLSRALSQPVPRHRLPGWGAHAVAAVWGQFAKDSALTPETVRYLTTHHYFQIGRARRDFGWQPAVSLASGIQRTANALLESTYGPSRTSRTKPGDDEDARERVDSGSATLHGNRAR